MSQYFPKPFRNLGRNINVKVDLSKYATKTDLKNVTPVNYSSFALKTKLVAKVNDIDTSEFVLKTKYQTGKAKIEKKIPNVTDLIKNRIH